jgi:hypothetical protein
VPFASYKVQALKGVLVRAKLLEKGNLPLLGTLPHAKVLGAAQAIRIVAKARIIIATYKLLARVNKVK